MSVEGIKENKAFNKDGTNLEMSPEKGIDIAEIVFDRNKRHYKETTG
jgi:hypothetical protein